MTAPVTYIPGFIENPADVFKTLSEELDWVHRDNTPRMEYYYNGKGVPYTYGRGAGIRTYESQPLHPAILDIREQLELKAGVIFEVCFLNRYRDGKDQLGWHSDDSIEMDDDRPIAIISLGAKREIYFRNKDHSAAGLDSDILWLESGSLCLMAPGMQDTHEHRIPKSGIANCGPRISLTFRGYKI